MSDRPSELEFKLQHIVIAVRDVATEWHNLGLQLGLPEHILKPVGSSPDIEGHLRMMLSNWLDYDPEASWDKLANALTIIGKNTVAANIRSKYVRAVRQTITEDSRNPVPDQEETKARQEMTQTVMLKIKRQFASLQVEVRSSMEARQVKVSDVHQFLVSFFQSECCIPEASDLTKLFNIITESKLWRYDHYRPLKELTETFLPDDHPARKLVNEYNTKLSGFYTTTKIIDFIKLSELEDFEDDLQDFSPEKYKMHYRKLTVKLKLGWKIKLSDMTMRYVDILWKALLEEFNLPPLTAIIKKIVDGSLMIEWLVPLRVSTVIAASYLKALRFYQQHNIVQVRLEDRTLYDEEWIIGSTPLYQASFVGNTDEVKEILEGGADGNERNNNEYGETSLFGACRGGHAETAKVLLDHGINVDCQNKEGQSALWCASSAGETECVKVLVKYGAQVDLPNWLGETALFGACRDGHVETARVLLDHGANVDHENNRGETALNLACYNGESKTVCLLLKAGAKTDIQDEYGRTALYWAAYKGHVNTIQVFNDCGTAVDIRDKDGDTALMVASRKEKVDAVKVLLEAKADPNITDEDGWTALYWAAWEGDVEVVKMLVKYGAAMDIRNKDGDTALMAASGNGKADAVKVLLEAKADPNITNEDGETALHKAALRGHVEVVKMLVKYGAAVDIRNKEGLTALDVARGHGYQAVCEVLEQYTKQETRTELTEEQRESFYQRLLKMAERIFLKEQVKKREEQQQQKEHHHQREERVRGEREKRSLWNRFRGHRNRPEQIIVTTPAPEK